LLKIEIRERESGRICGMRESESKMEREKKKKKLFFIPFEFR